MSSKMLKKLLSIAAITSVSASCQYMPFAQKTVITPRQASSVIVCRSAQCGAAHLSMTREFMYNSLLNLFDTNLESTVSVCEADPNTHACFDHYIHFPIKAGVTPATATIDSAKIVDVRLLKQEQVIKVVFDYDLHFNSVRPACRTSQASLFVRDSDDVRIDDTGFRCQFTTVGSSVISTVYSVDYVNLDYGEIGLNYAIGVSGPAYGGGSGYMLMRFPKTSLPTEEKKYVLPKPEITQPTTPVLNGQPQQRYGVKAETEAQKLTPGQYRVTPLPMR